MTKAQDIYLKKSGEENFDIQSETCSLFHAIITGCGELLTKCHTEEEVREMRDKYIIVLVGQYDQQEGFNANQCDVVREYRDSDRVKMELLMSTGTAMTGNKLVSVQMYKHVTENM